MNKVEKYEYQLGLFKQYIANNMNIERTVIDTGATEECIKSAIVKFNKMAYRYDIVSDVILHRGKSSIFDTLDGFKVTAIVFIEIHFIQNISLSVIARAYDIEQSKLESMMDEALRNNYKFIDMCLEKKMNSKAIADAYGLTLTQTNKLLKYMKNRVPSLYDIGKKEVKDRVDKAKLEKQLKLLDKFVQSGFDYEYMYKHYGISVYRINKYRTEMKEEYMSLVVDNKDRLHRYVNNNKKDILNALKKIGITKDDVKEILGYDAVYNIVDKSTLNVFRKLYLLGIPLNIIKDRLNISDDKCNYCIRVIRVNKSMRDNAVSEAVCIVSETINGLTKEEIAETYGLKMTNVQNVLNIYTDILKKVEIRLDNGVCLADIAKYAGIGINNIRKISHNRKLKHTEEDKNIQPIEEEVSIVNDKIDEEHTKDTDIFILINSASGVTIEKIARTAKCSERYASQTIAKYERIRQLDRYSYIGEITPYVLRLHQGGKTKAAIANLFSVSISDIKLILNKHCNDSKINNKNTNLSTKRHDVEILEAKLDYVSPKVVANKFGITSREVRNLFIRYDDERSSNIFKYIRENKEIIKELHNNGYSNDRIAAIFTLTIKQVEEALG